MRGQPRTPGRASQLGQSMVEYVIVVSFGILVLTTKIDPLPTESVGEGLPAPDLCDGAPQCSVMEQLANAIRNNYEGYSYAVSLSDYPDYDNFVQLRVALEDADVPEEMIDYHTDNPRDFIMEILDQYAIPLPVLEDISPSDLLDALGFDPFNPLSYF